MVEYDDVTYCKLLSNIYVDGLLREVIMNLKVNENYIMSEYDDDVILVPVSNNVVDVNCIHLLNRTGAIIMNLIANKMDIDEIINIMSAHGNVDKRIIEKEVSQYINNLIKQGIVVKI